MIKVIVNIYSEKRKTYVATDLFVKDQADVDFLEENINSIGFITTSLPEKVYTKEEALKYLTTLADALNVVGS